MRVRAAGPSDEAFVMDAWLRSFRPSWFAGPVPNDMYYEVYRKVIDRVRSRPGAQTLICCAEDDEDVILGFACVEPPGLVHYAYTKDLFRKKGVASSILAHAGIKDPVEYTFRTQDAQRATQTKNWNYNPFRIRDIERKERK